MRLTPKQFRGYQAYRASPCVNDAYNIREYGVTAAQARAIGRLVDDLGGGDPVSLAELNRYLGGAKVRLTRLHPCDEAALLAAFAVVS